MDQEIQTTEESKVDDKLPAKKEDKKSLIQEAREAAAELRQANEERAKLLKEERELLEKKEALMELGGTSYAGQKPIAKVETPKEYKDRIMNGKF